MLSTNAPLPASGFVRQRQLLGDRSAKPPVPGILPISPSTLHLWVQQGRFPRPVKLGPRVTAWRVEDIRSFIERQQSSNDSDRQAA